MRKAFFLFTALIPFLISTSCSKKNDNLCSTTEPPDSVVQISIIDGEGTSLIGEENIYKPSEITLNRGNQNIPLRFYEYYGKTFIRLDYYEMESEKDYILKLNEQETDVINLKIITYNSECFTGLRAVEKFLFNGGEIKRDNESYNYIIQI